MKGTCFSLTFKLKFGASILPRSLQGNRIQKLEKAAFRGHVPRHRGLEGAVSRFLGGDHAGILFVFRLRSSWNCTLPPFPLFRYLFANLGAQAAGEVIDATRVSPLSFVR